MDGSPILVTGATGFLGGAIIRRLAADGLPVRGLARDPGRARLPEGVEVVRGDLTDVASLHAACAGASAVISAAAVTGEKKPPPGGYDAVNADGVAALAAAAAKAGVGRIIHIGGIDVAGSKPGPYLRGRRRGDDAVRACGVPWTIVQPSVMFGPRAPFIAAMVPLAKLPIVPVVGNGRLRTQLVHVDDVVSCIAACLIGEDRLERTIELGGSEAPTSDELMDAIARALGKGRARKLHAPIGLVALQARLLQVLPRPPLTPATIELIALDNIAAALDVVEREFGFKARGFRPWVEQHGLELD